MTTAAGTALPPVVVGGPGTGSTAGPVTVPGPIRGLEAGDLPALLPGGQPAHIGVPDACRVELRSEPTGEVVLGEPVMRHVWTLVPTAVLPAGTTYFMPIEDVLGRAIEPQVSDGDALANLAASAGRALLSTAGKAISFVPLVYVAGGTMTSPTTSAKPAHALLTFSGDFYDGSNSVEIWSWGLTFAHVDSLGGTTAAAASKARALYEANVAGMQSAQVRLLRTRVALLQDGRHVTRLEDGTYDQGDDLTVVPGKYSGQVAVLPLQTALCISFNGRRPGPTGKGRAFLPLIQANLVTGWMLETNFAVGTARFVRNIAQGMSTGDGPKLGAHSVISGGGKGHTPSVTTIDTYRAGRIPDTMRTRRNRTDEEYLTA